MYSQEGRFVITSQTAGEYSICLSSSSSDWTKSLLVIFNLLPNARLQRVTLDIAVGDHALNFKEIASKEELNELELHIRQLLEQVATLAKDQDFQRVRLHPLSRLPMHKKIIDANLSPTESILIGQRRVLPTPQRKHQQSCDVVEHCTSPPSLPYRFLPNAEPALLFSGQKAGVMGSQSFSSFT